MAKALGLTVTPWSPLAGGWLTGKYAGKAKEQGRLEKTPQFARRPGAQGFAIAKEVVKVAKATGKSPRTGGAQLVARQENHSHRGRAHAAATPGQFEMP